MKLLFTSDMLSFSGMLSLSDMHATLISYPKGYMLSLDWRTILVRYVILEVICYLGELLFLGGAVLRIIFYPQG